MIILKPRIKRTGIGLKSTWYVYPGGYDMPIKDFIQEKKEGSEFKFDLDYKGKYKDIFNPSYLLFNLSYQIELKIGKKDDDLLRRVFENGGFVNYIEKLESML